MAGELEILQTIGQVLPHPEALQDDAFYDANQGLIYTTDMFIEHRHFKRSYFTPADLGWKSAAVNISDIAAMGGRLQYLLVSLGLPADLDLSFIREFYTGMNTIASSCSGQIVGGDTVSADSLTLNVTAIGVLPESHTIGRRSQAQPGDFLITTGYHGLSKAGLYALNHNLPDLPQCKQAHLRPIPRIEAGLRLSRHYQRYALMDSSDGLADAALKIAEASQVRVELFLDKLPVHPELHRFAQEVGQDLTALMLYGGEDFELIAAVPELPEAFQEEFTVIGRVASGSPAATLLDAQGQPLEILSHQKTYQHFQGDTLNE